jgi:hypothetical protein
MKHRNRIFALLLGLTIVALASPVSQAHEHRKVGPYEFVVGWADEPTFVGFKNAVQVILSGSDSKPLTDLGEGLKVKVIFGDQQSDLLPLEPAFGESWGEPGDYRASIIPTRPGTYTFQFVGEIKGTPVDQRFTSSEKTFDSPREPSQVEFPVKDPSPAELAVRAERLDAHLAVAAQGATSARTYGIIGIVLGAVAVVLGLRRRS